MADDGLRGLVQNKLTLNSYIKGPFKQYRKLHDIPKEIVSEGMFIIWRNKGLYWATEKPLFQAISFSDKRVYQWVSADKAELLKNDPYDINKKVSKIIFAFFTADFSRLEKEFDMVWSGSSGDWSVTLVPRSNLIAKAIKRLSISGGEYISKVGLESAAGDSTRIQLEVDSSGLEPTQRDINKIFPVTD